MAFLCDLAEISGPLPRALPCGIWGPVGLDLRPCDILFFRCIRPECAGIVGLGESPA